MAVRHPNLGEVESFTPTTFSTTYDPEQPAFPNAGPIHPAVDIPRLSDSERAALQAERPAPRIRGDGMRVILKAIKGLTDPDILKQPFVFQCPPLDTFSVTYGYTYTDYDTVRHGQLARQGGRQLGTASFSSLFVPYDAPWTISKSRYKGSGDNRVLWVPNPVLLALELKHILQAGTPFELMCGDMRRWTHHNIHWGPLHKNAATLRSLAIEEKAGEPDARYIQVEFHEHRSVQLLRRQKDDNIRDLPTYVYVDKDGDATFRDGAKVPGGHVTLRSLAKLFYRDQGHKYTAAIKKANGITDFAPSRNLGEWVARRKEKRHKVHIPAVVVGRGPGIGAGARGPGLSLSREVIPVWYTPGAEEEDS